MLLLVRLTGLMLVLVTWFDTTLGNTRLGLVSQRNQARRRSAAAYRAGHYREALTHYKYLVQTSPTPSLGERINLGHVYFQLGQYALAKRQYEQDGTDPTPPLRAVAATQLGLLACLGKDTAAALGQFRQALLNDPNNPVARQNFELLKLRFSGRQLRRQAIRPTPRPVPQPTPKVGQQVEKTEQQKERLARLRNTTLSDEQARQVLDALQADDLPYALIRRRNSHPATDKSAGRW